MGAQIGLFPTKQMSKMCKTRGHEHAPCTSTASHQPRTPRSLPELSSTQFMAQLLEIPRFGARWGSVQFCWVGVGSSVLVCYPIVRPLGPRARDRAEAVPVSPQLSSLPAPRAEAKWDEVDTSRFEPGIIAKPRPRLTCPHPPELGPTL